MEKYPFLLLLQVHVYFKLINHVTLLFDAKCIILFFRDLAFRT